MAIVVAHWPLRRRAGVTMLWCVAGFGVSTIVFGLSRNIALSLGALLAMGCGDSSSSNEPLNLNEECWLQIRVPHRTLMLKGKVISTHLLAIKLERLRGWFIGAAVVTLALPPFLVANCWLHLLGQTGVWRGWLPVEICSLGGATWLLSLQLWPIPFVAVWGAWRRLEAPILESDLRVTGGVLLRSLLLPLARADLGRAAILTFVLALNNFAIPAILQVKVFPAEIWVRFNTTFDTLGALALSWPLVTAPLLLLFWFRGRGSTNRA